MKIGYPCINLTIGCKGDRTFRLKSYSEQRLIETVENNLDCLSLMLEFNAKHGILFFRITSDLVPFASHPVCKFNWQDQFRSRFRKIGDFIKKSRMRISMHPDQFTLINSIDEDIFKRSLKELAYHAYILDLLELDPTAKIQIHVGGVYGNKDESAHRFMERLRLVDDSVLRRLVIENDERLYNLHDCIEIYRQTQLPVLFDVFHHELNNSGETIKEAFRTVMKTWNKHIDGIPMVDYSSHRAGQSGRGHAHSIDLKHFKRFVKESEPFDFDVMLEIKDKEKSVLKALSSLREDRRFIG